MTADHSSDPAVFETKGLRVVYPIHGGLFRRAVGHVAALDGVDLLLKRGSVLCVVGESGSGKTTLARAMVRMVEPTEGTVKFAGADLWEMSRTEARVFRRHVQMIFQNPYSSLNPRHTIETIVREPLDAHELGSRSGRADRVREVLDLVGLGEQLLNRYPHELSGGQRQRVAIARALTTSPSVLLLDEPVSALDMSIRAQIIRLLMDVQSRFDHTYVIISHDLALVRQIADVIAVLYLGRVVEYGPAEDMYQRPAHPYTHALMAAAPKIEAKSERGTKLLIRGEIPTAKAPERGCRFRDRCWLTEQLGHPEECAMIDPMLEVVPDADAAHVAACHFAGETEGSPIEFRPTARGSGRNGSGE